MTIKRSTFVEDEAMVGIVALEVVSPLYWDRVLALNCEKRRGVLPAVMFLHASFIFNPNCNVKVVALPLALSKQLPLASTKLKVLCPPILKAYPFWYPALLDASLLFITPSVPAID
jgi:hypothetical protein